MLYSVQPSQHEDIPDLLSRGSYSANWSEMGTYKTTTGLWLAEKYFAEHNISNPALLIITTKMGKGTYFDALPKTLPDWRVINAEPKGTYLLEFGGILEVPITSDEYIDHVTRPNPKVVLAHYNCFTNNQETILRRLLSVRWDAIIVDEAHRMKNRDGQWTRNIKKLKITERGLKHIMTGTGFINRPDEIWSLLNFLDKERFSSYWDFREYYVDEYVDTGTGYRIVEGLKSDKAEDFIELRKQIGIRRTLSEIRPDILEPLTTNTYVDLSATQRRMYNEIVQQLQTFDRKGIPISTPNVLAMLTRLRQVSVATPEITEEYFDEDLERVVQKFTLTEPSSKLDACMEIIDNMQWDDEAKQQAVVFSCFKGPLELLEKRLTKAGIPYLRLLGEMNERERYELWHDTWPSKEHRVFLTTLSLGGESINLTSAQHCIFLDRSWSPKDNMQAVGRVYRPGQVGQTQVIHINAHKTIDQRVHDLNTLKMHWFKELFDEPEDTSELDAFLATL